MERLEFVGTLQLTENGRRGNPVALYLERVGEECRVMARLLPLQHIVGVGATVNKAAGDFELKLKGAASPGLLYDGPAWNSGIKAEKPAPPKPAAAPAGTRPPPGGSSDVPGPRPAAAKPAAPAAGSPLSTPTTPASDAPAPESPISADPA